MDTSTLVLAAFVIGLALFFDFSNGFHDAANQVATVISSRALEPEPAIILAAVADFAGAYFLGTSVAQTFGNGIVDPLVLEVAPAAGVWVVAAALIGAILWNLFTWWYGIPSSSSHALIGGLLGAFVAGWGIAPVNWPNVGKILLIMVASPVVGLVVTYLFTWLVWRVSEGATPRTGNRTFRGLQVVSALTQALSHGTNDAQKTMGVITFVLVLMNLYVPPAGTGLPIPQWVIMTCALVMALGTATGGWRIIRTLGGRLYKVRPIHGFASQTTSSAIIYLTAVFGFPVSTTQVISSSVIGAGAALRPKMVRWEVAGDMLMAWLVTIPACAFVSSALYLLLRVFL